MKTQDGAAGQIRSDHWNDANGNPSGGSTFGNGFAISWQNGPLGRGPDRKEPNGAFVEDIILAALDRIVYYQGSRFHSAHTSRAIVALRSALDELHARTADREIRAVEGTHQS